MNKWMSAEKEPHMETHDFPNNLYILKYFSKQHQEIGDCWAHISTETSLHGGIPDRAGLNGQNSQQRAGCRSDEIIMLGAKT